MNIWDEVPLKIKSHIHHPSYEKDTIGLGDSHVYLFNQDKKVLKIFNDIDQAEHEIKAMLWLNQKKLLVPKVIAYEITKEKAYLLMTMLEGHSAMDPEMIKAYPIEVVTGLAEGLKYLWQIPIDECPLDMRTSHKLAIAKSHIDRGLVDMSDWDDEIIQSRFHSPMELYHYLLENQKEDDLVFSHGDYCLPNIWLDHQKIQGFIDLGLSGIADRHVDIALCLRSLKYNFKIDQYNALFLKLLDIQIDEEKIDYYLLLDELF
ncbi:MAG: aminoglycoside 3'-phosphotransferase [Acholeplasmataceae bacterium]|jgi:kanamycin kinase/aminoglycoside 3'-phosphotransferase-3|nr:aminoglycoside 3'-phosphotransferase [Acholeplasmataceae bacterium]